MAINPIQLQNPGSMLDGISSLRESLRAAQQMDLQREQHRANMLLRQGEMVETKRSNQANEAWRADQERRRRDDFRNDAIQKAREAYAKGDPEGARAILAGAGVNVDMQEVRQDMPDSYQGGSAVPDQKEPGATPPAAPQSMQWGPAGLMTPMEPPPQAAPAAPQPQRPAHGQGDGQLPMSEVIGYKLTGQIPEGGGQITMDPNTARDVEMFKRREAGTRLRQALPGEYGVEAEQAVMSLGNPERVYREINDKMEYEKRADWNQYALKARLDTSMRNTDKIADAMMRGKTIITPGQQADDARADEAAARAATKEVLNQNKYNEALAKNKKFRDMTDRLANPNAALDAYTAGEWVKQAQGGSGVVSDRDIEIFWDRIGGAAERSWSWVQGVIDGTIPYGKRQEVMAATRWLAQRSQAYLNEIKDAVDVQLSASPTLYRYRDQMIGTYFPEERKETPEQMRARMMTKGDKQPGGKVPPPNAPPAKKKSADDYLKGY